MTPKQRAFALEYLRNGRDGSKAYRVAYPNKMAPKGVAECASKLLRHPNVAPIIAAADEKSARAVEKVIDKYAITQESIARELALLGFSNMQDYMRVGLDGQPHLDFSALSRDQAAALQEVTVEEFVKPDPAGPDQDGKPAMLPVRKVKFRLSDKRAALVDLGKHIGMFKDPEPPQPAEDPAVKEIKNFLYGMLTEKARAAAPPGATETPKLVDVTPKAPTAAPGDAVQWPSVATKKGR